MSKFLIQITPKDPDTFANTCFELLVSAAAAVLVSVNVGMRKTEIT